MVIVAIGVGVPYMTYYNYKRIKAMDKKLTGMCTGLGIMLRPEEGDEEWKIWETIQLKMETCVLDQE